MLNAGPPGGKISAGTFRGLSGLNSVRDQRYVCTSGGKRRTHFLAFGSFLFLWNHPVNFFMTEFFVGVLDCEFFWAAKLFWPGRIFEELCPDLPCNFDLSRLPIWLPICPVSMPFTSGTKLGFEVVPRM